MRPPISTSSVAGTSTCSDSWRGEGFFYLALEVTDLDDSFAKLSSQGGTSVSSPAAGARPGTRFDNRAVSVESINPLPPVGSCSTPS